MVGQFAARQPRTDIVSFDLFVQFYEHGEPSVVAVENVRAAFGDHVSGIDATHIRLEYNAENRSYIDLSPDTKSAGAVTGFAVSRPCGDMRLWDALAGILRLGNAVLYFPGGKNPLVGSTDTVAHLPQEMIEALGDPLVVISGQAILAHVHAV